MTALKNRALGSSSVRCARCRKVRQHRARNLCPACYTTAYQDGTLRNYPAVKSLQRTNPPLVLDAAGIGAVCRAAVPHWDDLNRTRQKMIRDRITVDLKAHAWAQAHPEEEETP